MKGGAAGGGYAQVVPMDEINLHFTGDFHAITSANNLLAALIDNQVYWGNPLGIDPSKISWRRVMDMNDRALRDIVVGLGNNGQVREDGFDITVASEVMAIFCLANSITDLEQRLERIVVARGFDKKNVTAKQIQAAGAMTVLLRDAMQPNLVQTLEHTPAFVHGGPFANIAHGCNSVLATRTALKLADYVVTEAGFGADLGAEKFFDIKCRQSGLTPSAAVIVATVRALKMHGGVDKKELGNENVAAVNAGMTNLLRHIENVRKFGVPVTVAINHFTADTKAETDAIAEACRQVGVHAHLCRHWADGGKGAQSLAKDVIELVNSGAADFKPLYPNDMKLADKIRTVAREIYRAADISLSPDAEKKLKQYEADGFGNLPVCMAKTQYSFTAEPDVRGAPSGFILPVRDVRLSAGAGFVVAICGDIMTMPGLPREPAAYRIHIDADGQIEGLF
jgi:formate--tetrahydrofolate ligase